MALYKGKSFFILGLAKSGVSLARYLSREGATLYAWDDGEAARRNFSELNPANTRCIAPDEADWAKIDAIIPSPGIPFTHPAPHAAITAAQSAGVKILCDVDFLFTRYPNARFVGVTGSNGKSTVTALIAHILQHNGNEAYAVGNIGTPALDITPRDADKAVFVVECSSFQLDLCNLFAPQVAVWTNISPDHLDRHGSVAGYVAAKKRLFARQNSGDVAIIGVDDVYSQEVADELASKRNAPQIYRATYESAIKENIADFSQLPVFSGRHMKQNAYSAFAACRALGVTKETYSRALKSFSPLPHRMEVVRQKGRVTYVNDSKATNVASAVEALSAFPRCRWIVGGKSKGDDLQPLMQYKSHIVRAYAIGASQDMFSQLFEREKIDFVCCDTLEKAFNAAAGDAEKDVNPTTILLSPACASYDQWKNFEERGDYFRLKAAAA